MKKASIREKWRIVKGADNLLQLSSYGRIRKIRPNWQEISFSKLIKEPYAYVMPELKAINVEGFIYYIPFVHNTFGNNKINQSVVSLLFELFCGIEGLTYKNFLPKDGNFSNLKPSNMMLVNKDTFNRVLQEQGTSIAASRILYSISQHITVYNSKGEKDYLANTLASFRKKYGIATEVLKQESRSYQLKRTPTGLFYFNGYGPRQIMINESKVKEEGRKEFEPEGMLLNLSPFANYIHIYDRAEYHKIKQAIQLIK